MNNVDLTVTPTETTGWMRLEEIATRYKLSRVQVQRAMQERKLPAKRVMVVRLEDVERFAAHYLQPLPDGGYRVRRLPLLPNGRQE